MINFHHPSHVDSGDFVRARKFCDECESIVCFTDKFCCHCGAPQTGPFEKPETGFHLESRLKEAAKSHFSDFIGTCGVILKDADFAVVRIGDPLVFKAAAYTSRCAKCGKSLRSNLHYCTECGHRVNTYNDFYFELPASEVEAIVREAFYEKNPVFRPAQEQEYNYCVTVYRKWNGDADFCDEPFITLTAQSTKDKIHGIADLNEEFLNEDDEATALIEFDIGAVFKNCIENRWLEGNNFRDEHIVEKTCSLGDKHEFLIIVSIDEVK